MFSLKFKATRCRRSLWVSQCPLPPNAGHDIICLEFNDGRVKKSSAPFEFHCGTKRQLEQESLPPPPWRQSPDPWFVFQAHPWLEGTSQGLPHPSGAPSSPKLPQGWAGTWHWAGRVATEQGSLPQGVVGRGPILQRSAVSLFVILYPPHCCCHQALGGNPGKQVGPD